MRTQATASSMTQPLIRLSNFSLALFLFLAVESQARFLCADRQQNHLKQLPALTIELMPQKVVAHHTEIVGRMKTKYTGNDADRR